MKIINTIFPYRDFLYLLQLEEYESSRYFNLLKRFFLRRNVERRGKLVFTTRAKTTLLLSISLTILGVLILNIFTLLAIPIWVLLANYILDSLYQRAKQKIQRKAKQHFSENFKGKVIAIAGSYGKTTTKYYIYELLKYNYKVQMTPGTVNTPTGVANWILKNLKANTEILLIEMDSYFVGEIKGLCKITPPDIAILTNVGDQHLERLGTKANLKKALEEVFKYSKPNSIKIKNMKSNLDYALEAAKILNVPNDIIKDTVKKLKTPDRRGDTKTFHGFETIDQSYNISPTTAKVALEKAKKQAKNKKLVVITAGIPELGMENKNANAEYGELLKKSGIEIILLKSIFYPEVKKNINNYKDLHLAEDFEKAWQHIAKNYDPKKTLILMMPELGDQYY